MILSNRTAPPLTLSVRARIVSTVAIVGLVASLPVIAPNPYWVYVLTIGLVFAILASSWDLLYGVAGILSFGHAALFGVGAYGAALGNLRLGLNPWLGLVFGGIVAAGLGILFSAASVRLRGVYLALSTLAFAQTAQLAAANFPDLTRGTLGLSGYEGLPGLDPAGSDYFYCGLAICVMLVGGAYFLVHYTGVGLAWRAMRNDPVRASTLGMAVALNRLVVFVLASFMAGIAGGIYAYFVGVISPLELDAAQTAMMVAMAIIGGAGTLVGPALAGLTIQVLADGLRFLGGTFTVMAIGAMIMVFIMFMPGGMADVVRRVIARIQARRRSGAKVDGPAGSSK